jgi:hypothetical protein
MFAPHKLPLKAALGQVILKIGWDEGHDGGAEVGILQRRLSHGRKRLPGNKRLLSSDRVGDVAGVVEGPVALVLDERAGARQGVAVRGAVPGAVSRRADGP